MTKFPSTNKCTNVQINVSVTRISNVKRKTVIMTNVETNFATENQESFILIVLCSKLTFSFYETFEMNNAVLVHISCHGK
jgi:hypothetical protein